MRNVIYILIMISLSSCIFYDNRKDEVFITDKDYVENYRELSPDSSMLLINYSIDLGAFGYGQGGTAILKLADSTQDLNKFSIPNTLTNVKWIDKKNISAQFDILPYLRSGEKYKLEDLVVNEIKVHVSALDYIKQHDDLKIEHRESSPNKQFELIAYRYTNDSSGLNFIHVSVIPAGGQIPKHGNYLIADMQSDYVFFGTWTKKNELIFYSNNLYADQVQYYLVDKRPKIKYRVINDEKKYGSKYRWIEKSCP